MFYYFLFIHERHRARKREAETQAEGEAGPMQGAQCGTRSLDPGSCPELKADAQPLSHPGIPHLILKLPLGPPSGSRGWGVDRCCAVNSPCESGQQEAGTHLTPAQAKWEVCCGSSVVRQACDPRHRRRPRAAWGPGASHASSAWLPSLHCILGFPWPPQSLLFPCIPQPAYE